MLAGVTKTRSFVAKAGRLPIYHYTREAEGKAFDDLKEQA